MVKIVIDPTDEEIIIASDDIIVSKTNPRGIVEYANESFCAMSGYDEAELLGRPHNMVRHPDMPRCIFFALWETLRRRDRVMFYTKNMNKSGAFYWVKANIEPVFDMETGNFSGYHSTRTAFNRELIEPISKIYLDLKGIEDSYSSPAEGMMVAYNKFMLSLNSYEFSIFKVSQPKMVVGVG